MNPMHLALAIAALATPAIASAAPESADTVVATYQAKTKRFCVRTDDLTAAERTGTRIYQRQCLRQHRWLERGISFQKPAAATQFAAS